jgi:hypothetical protein
VNTKKGWLEQTGGPDRMIRIAISEAAFEAICGTLPLGSVSYENETNERVGV